MREDLASRSHPERNRVLLCKDLNGTTVPADIEFRLVS